MAWCWFVATDSKPPNVMVHFNMTNKNRKYHLLTLVVGILFLVTYFLRDFLWDKIWLFSIIPLVLFGMSFLGLFILTITTKNRSGILIGIVIIGTICLSELITSEIFKSKKILKNPSAKVREKHCLQRSAALKQWRRTNTKPLQI